MKPETCPYFENVEYIAPCGHTIIIGCRNCPNFEVYDQACCAYGCDKLYRCEHPEIGSCHFMYDFDPDQEVKDDPCNGRDCDACEIGGCDHGVEVK